MKKYIFYLTFLFPTVCDAQVRKADKVPNVTDNTWEDFSALDLFLFAARSLNPNSHVIPGQDTLVIQFDLPQSPKLTDSQLIAYTVSYYDALAIVMSKDSTKYKIIGISACNDPKRCGTAWFEISKHDYSKRSSFDEKLMSFLQQNFHKCFVNTSGSYNGESSMILRYSIDTCMKYSQREFIYSYFQSTSAVLANLINKSPQKIRRQYKELIFLFCSNGRLEYYWRLPLTDE